MKNKIYFVIFFMMAINLFFFNNAFADCAGIKYSFNGFAKNEKGIPIQDVKVYVFVDSYKSENYSLSKSNGEFIGHFYFWPDEVTEERTDEKGNKYYVNPGKCVGQPAKLVVFCTKDGFYNVMKTYKLEDLKTTLGKDGYVIELPLTELEKVQINVQ